MISMLARAIASVLVLVLVGPSVVTATCELSCALGRHHHTAPAPASSEAPCHEHQGSEQGVGVQAGPSTLCHESGDLPSAVVDAWLNSLIVIAAPAEALVLGPAVTATSIVRVPERRVVLDTRPPPTPLRI
jgi:hypothetical protein